MYWHAVGGFPIFTFNIYLKDAEKILAPYIGRRIEFEATAKQYRIVQTNRNTTSKSFSDSLTLPQPDVSDYSLRALANLRRDDSRYCGSKAANLSVISAPILQTATFLTDSAFRLPTIKP